VTGERDTPRLAEFLPLGVAVAVLAAIFRTVQNALIAVRKLADHACDASCVLGQLGDAFPLLNGAQMRTDAMAVRADKITLGDFSFEPLQAALADERRHGAITLPAMSLAMVELHDVPREGLPTVHTRL
jgi:hypothetical protein